MKFHNYPLLPTFFLLIIFSTACKKSSISPEKEATIKIDPSSLNIVKNVMIGYLLTVEVDNSNLSSVEVKWSSNNTRIASVNDAGYVTGRGAGETDIIATLVNGKGVAKCKVTVYDENDYKFRLILKDKGTSAFSVNRPEEFLSSRAIARRKKRNIAIDETDLPISPDYIKAIEKIGGVVVAQSKWLNTVSVHFTNEFLIDKYKELSFVKEVVLVWQGKRGAQRVLKNNDVALLSSKPSTSQSVKSSIDYGSAWDNINLNNGQALHEQGYKGAGIDIAVIDAGFINLKTNPSLSNIKIRGAKSFIYEKTNPYESDNHGAWVTSCMAANKPGFYIGTAPEANYWLLRTEDQSSEQPIEEDYWVAAIEFADSAGVDVVNTSLSYTQYGYPPYNYKWENLDGKSALASQGANIAVAKGIFIVGCAGNNGSWVGTPADSPFVLTVGSVRKSGTIDDFTSHGLTVDGRIKPDVVALGGGASVIDIDGKVSLRSGTSYASPIICGLAACLWQAYPKLNNKELLDVMKKSANRYNNPELPYGYGIPNMQRAMLLAQILTDSK